MPHGQQGSRLVIFAIAFGLFAPYSIAVYAGGLKLTPGKIVVTLLVLPALLRLLAGALARRRRIMTADLLAVAASLWMVGAPLVVSGQDVFVGATSQALEFFGSYMVGRAFLFGPAALHTFRHALGLVLAVVTGFAILDTVSHHYILQETLFNIFHPPGALLDGADPHFHRDVLGVDFLRATSTFDHPILYGSFCAVVGAIYLYSESSVFYRGTVVSLCLVGCVLSFSSASLLALTMGVLAFLYDRALQRYAWRWKALLFAAFAAMVSLSAVTENPLTWLIRHLTLDPQTGYFRLLMWDAALEQISLHPITGGGFNPTGVWLLDGSVDSLWLGKALNYGLPLVVLLLLAIMAATMSFPEQAVVRRDEPDIDRLCISFSLALVLLTFIGVSVYFWNGMWLFFALCIGVRTSLREYCLVQSATGARALSGLRHLDGYVPAAVGVH